MPQHAYGGQRIVYGSQSAPSTIEVIEIKLRSSGLTALPTDPYH